MSYEFEQLKRDFKTITKTGENMLTQSNRGTQYPLFVIQDVERRSPTIHEDPDGTDTDDDGNEYEYVEVKVFNLKAGVFFTEKAAQEHIDENSYHYTKPTIYVVSAWRNPEMQALMRQTINIEGKDLPSHYE